MATIQLFWENNSHSDSDIDDKWSWKKGYVVDIYPDGAVTEAPSPKSKTVFVHVPGVSVAEVAKYAGAILDSKNKQTKRRQYQFDISLIPSFIASELDNKKEYTLDIASLSELTQFIRDKETGVIQ